MKRIFFGWLLAFVGNTAAQAGEWQTRAALRANFGGPAASQFVLSVGNAYVEPHIAQPLPLTEWIYGSSSGFEGKLLGFALRNKLSASVTEGEKEGPSTLVWVGAAAAATLLAAVLIPEMIEEVVDESFSDEQENNTPRNCNGFSSNGIPGAGGEAVILGPDCEGQPEGGIRVPPN